MGKIFHKDKLYAGQHTAIIDEEMWYQVQDSIKVQKRDERHRWRSFFLLKGKLKTYEGFTMTPSFNKVPDKQNKHTNVSSGRDFNRLQKHVRYYVSRKAVTQGLKNCVIKTLNANLLEGLVVSKIMYFLKHNKNDVLQLLKSIPEETQLNHWLRSMIDKVIVGPDDIIISLDKNILASILSEPELLEWQESGENKNQHKILKLAEQTIFHQPTIKHELDKIVMTLTIMIKRVNGVRLLLSPEGKDIVLPEQIIADPAIVQAIGRGFRWKQMLEKHPDLSIRKFSANCGFGDTYVTKQLMLTGLAPDILHHALSGTLPSAVKLNRLTEAAECLSWDKQRRMLGLN